MPISIITHGASAPVNNIGVPGLPGFGVGICPAVPAGMTALPGCTNQNNPNYGNYIYSDGSIMCWIPAFYYLYGTGANGLGVNVVNIKPLSTYADEATANAAGYALHRAFYDGGAVTGFFVDKFQCSNNAGTASSLRLGNPLSSAAAHNPFAGLTGTPANFYYGAIAAAKTRGANFFCSSRFIFAALALLSLAHGQASAATAWCAWFSATTTNFPKGNNNNNASRQDYDDNGLTYASDGYSNCGKTGSANVFAKTTHNGQFSGVADLNGNVWEITPGLATDDAGTTYYALKTATRMKDVTGGTDGATDLWGAAGLAALYDSLGATFGVLQANSSVKKYGTATQVLDAATSGAAWTHTGLGVPMAGGADATGTALFGKDGLWDYRPAALCPISGGGWDTTSAAGVWAFGLNTVRGSSSNGVGFRSALYL
jgi:hypothetical protein